MLELFVTFLSLSMRQIFDAFNDIVLFSSIDWPELRLIKGPSLTLIQPLCDLRSVIGQPFLLLFSHLLDMLLYRLNIHSLIIESLW